MLLGGPVNTVVRWLSPSKCMRYFRYRWDESRGDEFDYWGRSTHWYEMGDDGFAARQMEVYENGIILKYDSSHVEDQYGFLSDQPLEPEKYSVLEVSADEFDEE